MEQVSQAVLVEALTDLQIEIKTIHKCLEQLEVLPELVKEKRGEVEEYRGQIRSEVLKRLSALQSGDPKTL